MKFYTSIFRRSKIGKVTRYTKSQSQHGKPGSVLTVSFELEGVPFTALNGGPQYNFTPAVSFFIHCDSQGEIDRLWDRFSEDGGEPIRCGWRSMRSASAEALSRISSWGP